MNPDLVDVEVLRMMVAEDELGLLIPVPKHQPTTTEDRLLAGFLEIVAFVELHERSPETDTDDVTEFQLATRLQAICADDDQRNHLRVHDTHGILHEPAPPETMEDMLSNDPLGLLTTDDSHSTSEDSIFDLVHVPAEQAPPDKVAKRRPCPDFEQFADNFIACHEDLASGRRQLRRFRNPSNIEAGKYFVQSGVLVYVAEANDLYPHPDTGGLDGRIRCIYENGTEADLLLRSLARSLYDDGRIVTEPDDLIAERMGLEPSTKLGRIYVLGTKSQDPQLTEIPFLHKIGSTTQSVERRVANAPNDATFLNADVEILAEYELPAVAIRKFESALHKFFAAARLDMWLNQADKSVDITEWFSVPLPAIDKAIELISNETVGLYRYDRGEKRILLR